MPWVSTVRKAPPRVSGDAAGVRMDHLVARHRPALRQLLTLAFADTQHRLPTGALMDAIAHENLAEVETLVQAVLPQLTDTPLRTALEDVLRQMMQASMAANVPALQALLAGPGRPALTVQFGVPDPHVLALLTHQSGTLITGINGTTLTAVRETLSAGMAAGENVQQIARTLRRIVGLSPRQARQVENFRLGLRGIDAPRAQIDTQSARLAQRLLRQRADVIARHELLVAGNTGQYQQLLSLRAQGVPLPPVRRYWVVAPGDERVCAICRPIPGMNPEGVGIQERFRTPQGPVLFPPLHVQCRCVCVTRAVAP